MNMRIDAAKVIVTSPGRNFVTLKLLTNQGVYGIGDATLNGRELAVASYLNDHVLPCIIGKDPRQIEDIWQYLYRGAYWRRGPVTMSAIAAVDVALWDIKAKMAGLPLYDLLGGKSRNGVLVYGHANGADIGETIAEVERYIDLGYRAIRAQSGIPGLGAVYGVGRGKDFYEPAERNAPTETTWDTTKYLNFIPTLFERLRARFGFDQHLLHDVHHRLRPIEAARLGKELEPYGLFWLEDATPAENQDAFKLIRQHTVIPLATGEVFNSIWDCKDLIQNQLIDYIRTPVVRAGGITHLRRIADFASVYQVLTGAHGATDLSPVTMGAAQHFNSWVPNFGIQEYMRHTPETDAVFPHAYYFKDGSLHPGDAVGHGVDIDEQEADKFPYQRAYLPIARLEDGSMFNW
jgi:mannonate dehydratase